MSTILFETEVFGIRYRVRTAFLSSEQNHKIWLLAFDQTQFLCEWDLPYNKEFGIVWPDYIVNAGDDEICIEARNRIDKIFALKAFW